MNSSPPSASWSDWDATKCDGARSRRLRFLLADDPPEEALRLDRVLIDAGHEVCRVPDGPCCLEALERDVPHVILLNARLHGMERVDLIRRIKRDVRLSSVLLVILTRGGSGDDKPPSDILVHADDVVYDSNAPEEWLQRLRSWCRLIEVKKRMIELVEHTSDGYFSLDADLVVTYVNRAAEQLLDRRRKDLVGHQLFASFPEARESIFETRYRRALEDRRSDEFDVHFTVAPYANWYRVRVFPQGDGLAVFFQVITVQKETEAASRFQAQLLDSVRESVVATDLDGRITYWGHGAEQLYGYLSKEVLGKSITLIVAPEAEEEEAARMAQVMKTGLWSGQYAQRRKDGSVFWADTFISLVRDAQGHPTGLVGIDRDITRQKTLEHLLRASNRVLVKAGRYRAIEPLLRGFLEEIRQVAPCDAAALYLANGEGNLTCRAQEGFPELCFEGAPASTCIEACPRCRSALDPDDPSNARHLSDDGSISVHAASQRPCAVRTDANHAKTRPCRELGFESIAVVPIRDKGGPIGLVHLADRCRTRFPSDVVQIVETVTQHLGPAIRRVRAETDLKDSHQRLAQMVEAQTTELRQANRDLKAEIRQRRQTDRALKLNEARLESLLRLSEMSGEPPDRLAEIALEESVALTESQIGFINFLSEDEAVCIKAVYPRETVNRCSMPVEPTAFRIADCGLWSEACRRREPIIVNDYEAAHPGKLGLPEGHMPIIRFLSIPVFEKDRVVAVAALANKSTPYDERDVRQFRLFMEGMGNILQRRRAEEALLDREETARALLDATLESIFLLDPDGTILQLNETAARRLGTSAEEMIGRSIYDFLDPKLAETRRDMLTRAVTSATPLVFQDRRKGRVINHSLCPVLDDSGHVVQVAVFGQDVTDKLRAEEQLRKSEQLYRLLAEHATDVITKQTPDGIFTFVSPSCRQVMGYEPDEMLGRNAMKFFHPNDTAVMDRTMAKIVAAPVIDTVSFRFRRRDGSFTWLETTSKAVGRADAKQGMEIVATTRSIAQRKRAEEALRESEARLRSLSTQLLNTQEVERHRIAVELHDELGQALMVLRLQLGALQRGLPHGQTRLKKTIEEAFQTIDETTEKVRWLSRELRPPILEDLGLAAALTKLIEDAGRHSSAKIIADVDDMRGIVPGAQEITLFRVFQEALTNALRHAGGTKIRVTMRVDGSRLSCEVADNGRGFSLDTVPSPAAPDQGMGLTIMQERVGMMGGAFEVDSMPNAGTRIRFSIPLPSEDA